MPSVRTDLHEPRARSIANTQNYGNEPNVFSLLSPCATAERGVNEAHFVTPRRAPELESLLSQAGLALSGDDFARTFVAAAAAEGSAEVAGGATCTIHAFLRERNAALAAAAGF